MMYKPIRALLPLLLLFLALCVVVSADGSGQHDLDMSDPGGHLIIAEPDLSAVGEFSSVAGHPDLQPRMRPPSELARRDYENVYTQAKALLDTGVTYRTTELQIVPSATITDALKNYQDFNGGALFYKFCSDYDRVDEQGYCFEDDSSVWFPPDDPGDQIRARLIRARELFGFLSMAEPADTTILLGGQETPVRELGRTGVLTATREIANVHLIFGNEFLVDALDYRFSAGANPSADQIIQKEIDQLNLALQQFTLAVDILAYAFNADFGGPSGVHIGDYFTNREFELFGITSERMVMAMDEIAKRYRDKGQDQQAMAVYSRGFTAQYAQALALAQKAAEQDADFLYNGGWQLMNNLGRLGAQAQAIRDGLNPFGFRAEYVPLQPYSELENLTRNQFLRDASEDEIEARNAQREFDVNATQLQTELQNQRLTYDNQLLELCGASSDDYRTCEGGLMAQNYFAMSAASKHLALARQRLTHIPEQIRIEQDRAGQVILLSLHGGQALSAISYAIGVENSERWTETNVDSTTDEWYAGASVSVSAGYSLNPGAWFSASATASAGYNHSSSHTSSVAKIWDPEQIKLGEMNGLRDVQQAATEADITGANSEATIRNLLLQQADLMIEQDITLDEWNRLCAEHNHLVEKYRNLLNLRVKAQDNLVDSYLNNPAYRVLRDSLTVEAARSHGLAAQFAYLTAKALEYDFLTRPPFLADIFKARSADDIDNFMNGLEQWRVAISNPGYLNRFPYRISVAQDILGLSDENLDPDDELESQELADLRLEQFQAFLQGHVVGNALEFPFTTSLLDNNIFSPSIWNNRIAGVNLPKDQYGNPNPPDTKGVSINVLTRQFSDVGTPEIILIHGGHATYRTSASQIVEYVPGNAMLVGYQVPTSLNPKTRTAVILSSVNGNARGTPTSALFNLSVAASDWTLKVNLTSPYNHDLDISQIEDIEILVDSTAYALPGLATAAEKASRALVADFKPTQQGEER